MIRLSKSLLALCAALSGTSSFADTVHDEQAWVNLTLMGAASKKIVYFLEAQPRFGDGVTRLDALLLRAAIGVRLSKSAQLYQGYGYIVTPRAGSFDLREHRSFQQLSWVMAHPFGGEFSTRTRLEQRWRNDGGDMGLRGRVMARLEVPVAKNGLAVLGYDELFVGLKDTDWGSRSGFDQNRAFLGAEIPVGGKSTVELGYLNQIVDRGGGQTRMNHALALALFIRR